MQVKFTGVEAVFEAESPEHGAKLLAYSLKLPALVSWDSGMYQTKDMPKPASTKDLLKPRS